MPDPSKDRDSAPGTPRPTQRSRIGTSSGNLLRNVRDRFHPGKRSPNPFNVPSTGRTLVEDPSTPSDTSNTPERSKRASTLGSDTLPFSECKTAFALDISGSTAGKVLRVERSAIEAISDGLAAVRKRDSQILPWNNRSRRILTLDELDTTESAGGTDPTVILTDLPSKRVLMGSDIWFLLTDGEIDGDLIRNFAHEVGVARLHGTACVIVVFGSFLERPVMCNISVGQSVFAATPDCLFLFHDFESGKVYILQCKGAFRYLLPNGNNRIVVTHSTRWEDLPNFSYAQLHKMLVPKPRQPEADTLILSGGRLLYLDDIYNDSLGESDTQLLLSRSEDLDTLILTAHTRGRADDVRKWVSRQRLQNRDLVWMDRPDEHGATAKLIRALVNELRSAQDHSLGRPPRRTDGEDEIASKIETLQGLLRDCHRKNWEAFCSASNIKSRRHRERNNELDVVEGGLNVLSPPEPAYSPAYGPHLSPPSCSPTEYYQSQVSRKAARPGYAPVAPPSPQMNRPLSEQSLVYLKGFEAIRKCKTLYEQELVGGVYDTCGFCRESKVILCLLLKAPPDIRTEGFPALGSKSKHRYPLVLGNYPETDVVSSLVCCDACSHFLLQFGETPAGERLVAALPLVPLHREINKSTWFTTLTRAFENRFHDEILISVLLSAISSTINDLSSSDTPTSDLEISILNQAFHHVASLSASSGITSPSSMYTTSTGNGSLGSLRSEVSRALTSMEEADCQLLFYPLDGCVVLVQVSEALDPIGSDIQKFVWLRILFHFSEKHFALRVSTGDAEAIRTLLNIILEYPGQNDEASQSTKGKGSGQRKSAISISQLEGTYFFPVESREFATFERLGKYGSKIRSSYASATATFLGILHDNAAHFASPEEFFNSIRAQETYAKLFRDPENLDEEMQE